MKIAIAHFQVSYLNRVTPCTSRFLSELYVIRNNDYRMLIKAALNHIGDEGQSENELLRSFQEASNQLLEQTLDHTYRQGVDIIVVRGLA